MRTTAAQSSPRSTPKRDRLLDTAFRLFYRDGYHAVGIDLILAEAGLAKMTLYHHFSSKEELIVAALEKRGQEIAAAIAAAVSAAGPSPRQRLLAILDWHEAWFRSKDFNGCAFIRAAGEYPELSSPVHQLVAKRKQASRRLLEEIAADLGVNSATDFAGQIQLLLEGAIVIAQTSGNADSIRLARSAVLALVKAS